MTNANANTHPSRPNFFLLLGLNPDDAWSEEHFKSLLHEKQNEWSRLQMSVGQKALVAEQHLKLIPEILAVMMDETFRQEEAREARLLAAAGRKAKAAEFETQLAFINAKTSIEESEQEKFISDFQDIYSVEQIKKQIKVPFAHSSSPGADNKQALDAAIARNIANLLNIVSKPSLYDMLALPDVTASQELVRAAEELYKREVQRSPKTPEVKALVELAGLAKLIFQSEDTRKQYDESLRRVSLDRLLADLDTIMSRVSSKELHSGQVNLFLENAQRIGWEREEAYARLMEHARLRKWFLAPTSIEARVRCRKCNHLNDRERKLCAECGAELYTDCPNCGQQVSGEDRVCDHCGFAVGNRYMVDQRLDELKRLFDAGEFGKAQEILRTVEEVWNPKNPDSRFQRIQEYKARLQQREQQQEQTVRAKGEQLWSLMSEKRYHAAKLYLDQHSAVVPDAAVHRRTILENIHKAELMAQSLQKTMHTLNPDDRIRRAREIEDICKDLPDLDKLRIPPAPPANLQAKVIQGAQQTVVNLSWRPSSTPDVYYAIVRKSHAPPTSLTDGQELPDHLEACTYNDTAASPVGVPLYYAVYSGYSNVRSKYGAVLSRPVMVTQSVSQVTTRVDNQLVELRWETPSNVHSILVVRKEQSPPASISDGVRIGEYLPTQKSLSDRNVQNGQVYHYALFCQFKDQDGQLLLSPAQYASATPDTPPRIIQKLDIAHKPLDPGFEVTIHWQRPDKGNVVIMKTDKQFSLPVGKVIPQEDLILHGEKLGPHPVPIVERWASAGIAYYTPVILYQGMAYVGVSQPHICMESITKVEYQNLGDRIRFRWKWPANCNEVEVAYGLEDFPPNDPNAMKNNVSRARYEKPGEGFFDLQGAADQEFYVIISAIITENGTQTHSEGFRDKVRQASLLKLRYEVRQAGLLSKKRTLHITTNRSASLPQMRLVGKRGKLPFSKSDGELIQAIEPKLVKRNEVDINLPERTYQSETFVRLFLEDDTMYDWIEIINPEKNKLRLS